MERTIEILIPTPNSSLNLLHLYHYKLINKVLNNIQCLFLFLSWVLNKFVFIYLYCLFKKIIMSKQYSFRFLSYLIKKSTKMQFKFIWELRLGRNWQYPNFMDLNLKKIKFIPAPLHYHVFFSSTLTTNTC
jgi:hypothetical protein